MENLFANLNEQQQEAVRTIDGPVLILAGAGSGKTTVLVNRIAYMISEGGIYPSKILTVTFTNKAAKEMKQRVSLKIGDESQYMWIGTFHSTCVRILRTCIDRLGYEGDFVIYDTADSKTVMKECLKEENLDEKNYPVRAVLSVISKAKDDLQSPEIFESVYKNDYRMSVIAKLYNRYQRKLKSNNALDFDDIVLNTVRVLSENPEVLERWQEKFRYIMVDEYQDTNNAQYMLISLLAGKYRNLCVVGDDDQSIYKFRGANIRNILDFEREFPDALVIKLEQNYRSTQNILDAANFVIANNKGRKGKALWTDKGDGEKIKMYTAYNEHDEGRYIASKISEYQKEGGKFSDCAILYRTNAQSRVLEEMLIKEAVPYRVLAGLRFYDRKEIKDIVAYLRVIHNPNDDISVKRIINEPKRKIGLATMDKVQHIADIEEKSVFSIIAEADKYADLTRAASKLKMFAALIMDLIEASNKGMRLTDFVAKVMNDTGYSTSLMLEGTVEAQTRLDNLTEFMSVVEEFEKTAENDSDLGEFLESVSLISDIDAYDEDEDAAVLMTIHSAKGLEFPTVFLAGMEDGLFPGQRSMNSEEDLEEERRLCYVAITRARDQLYITNTMSRMIFGQTVHSIPSRFLKEIPPDYIEAEAARRNEFITKASELTGMPKMHRSGENYKKETVTIGTVSDGQTQPMDFKPGDRVEHRKFGQGTVVDVRVFGKDAKLEINFDNAGKKQLMAMFAKLKKL